MRNCLYRVPVTLRTFIFSMVIMGNSFTENAIFEHKMWHSQTRSARTLKQNLSLLHLSSLSFSLIENRSGGCDLVSVASLPTHEVAQTLLAALEDASLRLIEFLGQVRHVRLVCVL